MSFTEIHRVTPKAKLYSGCGDGAGLRLASSGRTDNNKKRVPIPSCRRFATRPVTEERDIRKKLERAIIEFETPPKQKKPRRKSMTMAEITPTKRKLKSNVSEGFMTDVESTVKEERVASRRSRIDAGRRVYKLLLLNAWRRRRIEVATLSESLKQIKAQNGQLQMQADVLQKLRESECRRRDQAVTENGTLKEEIFALMKTNNLLVEDNKCLEERIFNCEEEKVSLKVELSNVQNNLLSLKAEMKCMEEILQNEKYKVTSLKEELRVLNEKIVLSEKDTFINQEVIKKLKEGIVILENKLLEERQCAIKQDAILTTLKRQLLQDKENNEKLNDTIKVLLSEKLKLQSELEENAKKFNQYEKDKDELKNEIQILKMQVEILKVSLRNERNKPWWMATRDVFRYPFALFKTAAVTMLPALSQIQNGDFEKGSNLPLREWY